MGRGRRALRGLAWMLAVLVGLPLLLATAAWLFLSSRTGNRWLLERAEQLASDALPGAGVEAGDLRTDLLRTLTLEDVRLVADDGEVLVRLQALEVRWNPLALLGGEVHLDRLVLREPGVRMEVGPDGRVDLLDALGLGSEEAPEDAGGAWEGLPVDLVVEQLRLVDGRVTVVTSDGTWTLEDLQVAGAVALEGPDAGLERLVASAALVREDPTGETRWPLGLAAEAALEDGDLAVDLLRVRAGDAGLEVTGRVASLQDRPFFDLDLVARGLEPRTLEPLVGDLGVEGPFGVVAAAEGPVSALQVRATLFTPAGRLRLGAGLDLVSEPMAWNVQVELDDLQLDRFVEAVPGPTRLEGTLALAGTGTEWPAGISGEGRLDLADAEVAGVDVGAVAGTLEVAEGQLRIPSVRLETGLGTGQIRGDVDLEKFRTGADVELSGVRLDQLRRFGLEGLQGAAGFDGRVDVDPSGDALALSAEGVLTGADVAYGELVEARTLRAAVTARVEGDQVTASGTLDAAGVRVEEVQVGSVEGPWSVDVGPSGLVDWSLEATLGELRRGGVSVGALEVDATGTVGEGTLPQVTADVVAAGVDLGDPALDVATVRGRVALSGQQLDVVLEAASEAERPVLDLAGAWDLETGLVALDELLVAPSEDVRWVATEPVRVQVVEGGVRNAEVHLASPTGTVRIQGDAALDGALDLDVRVTDLTLDPLVPLLPFLPEGLAGQTSVAFHLGGTADRLQGAGTARVRHFAVPGAVRRLDADLTFSLEEDVLVARLVVPATASGDGRRKVGTRDLLAWAEAALPVQVGTVGLLVDETRPWSLDLVLGPGSVRRWERVLVVDELPEAELSARLVVEGTPAQPHISLAGLVEVPAPAGVGRVRAELAAAQEGDRLTLDGAVAEGLETQVRLRGTAETRLPEVVAHLVRERSLPADGLDASDPATWVSAVDLAVPLDLEMDVLRRVVPVPVELEGRLVGTVRVGGEIRQPELTAALELEDARLGGQVVSPARVTLEPAEGGYQARLSLGFGTTGGLSASVHLPAALDMEGESLLAPAGTDGLRVEAAGAGIPLAAIAAFVPGLEQARGLLSLEGTVEGSLERPEADLAIRLEEGAFQWSTGGILYEDVALEAYLEGERLRLDHLSAVTSPLRPVLATDLTRGHVVVRGSVLLAGGMPDKVSLNARLDRAWLVDRSDLRLVVSGELLSTGAWPALGVEGEVVVDDARVVLDEAAWMETAPLVPDPMMVIHRTRRGEAVAFQEAKDEGAPWYAQLDLGLDLDLGTSTEVEIRMPLDDRFGALYASLATVVLKAGVEGALVLGLAEGEPTLRGEVEAARGEVEVLDARFDLDEGTVAFAGDPADPVLDVEAVHDAGEYGEVRVDMSGSVADLELSFTNEEYPEQADIASILILGRPVAALSAAEGDLNSDLVALATGALVGELERTLGAGLDLVEIQTSDRGGFGGITLGQAITRDVFVVLTYRPDAVVEEGENITEASVEWRVGRHWTVDLTTGDQGTSAADLYRTWSF